MELLSIKQEVLGIQYARKNLKLNNTQGELLNRSRSDTHALTLILHQAVPAADSAATMQTSSRRPVIVASDGSRPPA